MICDLNFEVVYAINAFPTSVSIPAPLLLSMNEIDAANLSAQVP